MLVLSITSLLEAPLRLRLALALEVDVDGVSFWMLFCERIEDINISISSN